MNPDELIDRYRRLRDKVKEIKDRHSAELLPYMTLMGQLEATGLRLMQESNTESLRTAHGTMFIVKRDSFSLSDPALFKDWCQTNNRIDLLESRVAKQGVQSYLEETGVLPPGVKVSSDLTVNIRK